MPYLAEQIVEQGRVVDIKRSAEKVIPLKRFNVEYIINAMVHADEKMHREGVQIHTYKIAGKSGVAQVYVRKLGEKYSDEEVRSYLQDHDYLSVLRPLIILKYLLLSLLSMLVMV